MVESFEVERQVEEESNIVDLALSTPLPLSEEKEEGGDIEGGEVAAADEEAVPPSFVGRVDPLPPCMLFFQVQSCRMSKFLQR